MAAAKRAAPREGDPLQNLRPEDSGSNNLIAHQARRRRLPEAMIQRAVFAHLRARSAPGVFAFHVPNGGYRRPREAAILKGLGLIAGVPDIIAIHNGRCFALELKAPGGRTTGKQLATIAAMEVAGVYTCIAEGLDRALAVLEAWGLLRGRVS